MQQGELKSSQHTSDMAHQLTLSTMTVLGSSYVHSKLSTLYIMHCSKSYG